MAYPDDELLPPRSDTALQPGGFKARDEMRREERRVEKQIKLGERIDRNLNRAIRTGDSRKAATFADLKKSFNGGEIKATGITHFDDRQQRVKDAAAKGSEFRFNAGRIGEVRDPAPAANSNQTPAPVGTAPATPQAGNAPQNYGFRSQEDLMAFEQSGSNPSGYGQPNVGTPPAQPASIPTPPSAISRVNRERVAEGKEPVAIGDGAVQIAGQPAVDSPQAPQQPQVTYEGQPLPKTAQAAKKPLTTNEAMRERQEFIASLQRGVAQRNAPQKARVVPPEEIAAAIPQADKMSSALENQRGRMSPEAFATLERSIKSLTPEQRQQSIADGAAKGAAAASKVDPLIGEARELATRKVPLTPEQVASNKRTNDVLVGSKASMDQIGYDMEVAATKKSESLADAKAKKEAGFNRIDQIYAAQKGITDAYFQDTLDVEARNKEYTDGLTSQNPIERLATAVGGKLEESPNQPTPLNYDDPFDPANPPKYARSTSSGKADDPASPSYWNVKLGGINGGLSPDDPRYAAIKIKENAYSKAFWAGGTKDSIRKNMINEAIEKGVDISGITKQDEAFHKQYEETKKARKQLDQTIASLGSVPMYPFPQ